MNLKLSISSCPNDTFMFDALIHRKIDTKGHTFDVSIADIQQLNTCALQTEADISKISTAMYPLVADHYRISRTGNAMGQGNGPLLVSRHKIYPDEVPSVTVGIPGIHTTANRLLEHVFGPVAKKKEYLFSEIATAVLDGETDAGILIHEQRFTYQRLGLRLISDLGAEWERSTSLPIPLGSILIKRSLELKLQKEISFLIGESIRFGFTNPSSGYLFIKQHARELEDEIIAKHIDMFVNDYSLDLTNAGEEAIGELVKGEMEFNREEAFI